MKVNKLFSGTDGIIASFSEESQVKDANNVSIDLNCRNIDDRNIGCITTESSQYNIQDIDYVIDIFKGNIHTLTPMEHTRILNWCREYNCNELEKKLLGWNKED